MNGLKARFGSRILRKVAGAMVTAVVIASSQGAFAGQVATQFYHGKWSCTLDGRSTKMTWKVVSDTQSTCSQEKCSVSHGAKSAGSFYDRNGPWVTLTLLSASTQSITFRHADGNKWYLARSGTKKMSGHSTWQGNQYPLSCSR